MRVVALIGGDMKATATTLVALALAISLPAHAQVFRCVDGEGHTVFSDTNCGTRAEKVEVVQSSGGLSARTLPAGEVRARCRRGARRSAGRKPADLQRKFRRRTGGELARAGAPKLLTLPYRGARENAP